MVKGAEYLCLNLISDYSKIKRINHERIPIARRSTLLVRLFFIKLIILLFYKSKGSRGLVVRALTYPVGRSSQLSWENNKWAGQILKLGDIVNLSYFFVLFMMKTRS